MSLLPLSRDHRVLLTALGAAVVLVAGTASAPPSSAAPSSDHSVVAKPKKKAKSRQASVKSMKIKRLSAQRRALTGLQAGVATPYAELADTGTRDYGMVGVTWAHGTGSSGVKVKIRTLTAGTWSTWQTLETDEDGEHGSGTREGTEPLWVGSADGVAARVMTTGDNPPSDLRIDLVDPGTTPVDAAPTTSTAPSVTDPIVAATSDSAGAGAGRAVGSTALATPTTEKAKPKKPKKKPKRTGPDYTPRPAIFTRAQWGARASSTCDSPVTSPTMLGVVVHHTAGSNSYTPDQSPAIVRAVQAYHQNARGWCDIGYNFLVDKYGQIFEGRAGGVDGYQVRGAHAGNFDVNLYDLGVSMMGNLDVAKPTAAMKAAMVQLIGWKLGTTYTPAKGRYALDGHLLKRISGHRDVYLAGFRPATRTACPGKWGYRFLTRKTGLRFQVANYIADYTSPIKTLYTQLGGPAFAPVTVGEAPIGAGMVTKLTNGDIYSGPAGAHFVSGPIRTAYAAKGGATGTLGLPVGDQVQNGTQLVQQFQGGTITYDTATGVTS